MVNTNTGLPGTPATAMVDPKTGLPTPIFWQFMNALWQRTELPPARRR